MSIIKHRVTTSNIKDNDNVSLELVSADTSRVRYLVFVVDQKSGGNGPFAVFIVPHGR